MIIKRKKNTRQRGTHTHGWGSKKKHRGAGNRGGRGNAGSGKRGDGKKPSYWKDRSYYKSKGFTSLKKPLKAINIESLHKFDNVSIDLTKEGYDKLLAKGTPDKKYHITVFQASESAIEKIKKAGGSVKVLQEKNAVNSDSNVQSEQKVKESVDEEPVAVEE